jgi:hypothetical protein
MFDFRQFEATDPFGHAWTARFLWQQNAISIRHADAIDVKFVLTDGETKEEKVIAMPHPRLKALSAKLDRAMNDAWCNKLAALHLKKAIETGENLEKALILMSDGDLDQANRALEASRTAAA